MSDETLDPSTGVSARAYRTMREVEDAHWWHRGMETISRRLLDDALGAGTTGNRLILDAGCGTGRNLQFLARYGSVTGMDFSPLALECCAARGLARLVRASVNETPFADGSFDLVTSFDVLMMRSVVLTRALANFARILRPGGHLMIRVPANDRLRGRHDDEWNVQNRFERNELCREMKAAGFEIRRASYANTWLFPVAMAKRLLERVFPPDPHASDLEIGAGNGLVSRAMAALLGSEAPLVASSGGGLPFGLSLYVLGRKAR